MRILLVESDAVSDGAQLVGALADLGVNPSSFEWEFSKVDVGDFHMHFERPEGGGAAGVAFSIHPGATHHEHRRESEHGDEGHEIEGGTGGHEHNHADDHPHAHGHGSGHQHASGTENRRAPAHPDLNASALRELIKNSSLSDRSKELSLALLTQLATSVPASRGSDAEPEEGNALSESDLSLLAQVVLIAVGIDQLGIDQISVVPLNKHGATAPAGGGQSPSGDPVIAAVQAVLPRSGAPAGLRRVKSGVGLPASIHTPAGARIEVSLLES